MSNNRLIVPATAQVRAALIETGDYIDALKTHRISDRSHFGQTAQRLEQLALALLAAGSSGSLLAPKINGARFDIGPGTTLAKMLSEAAGYLGGDAALTLRHGGLSEHRTDHHDKALDLLKALRGMTIDAIRKQAEGDLDSIRRRSVGKLLTVADELANMLYGDPEPDRLGLGAPVDDLDLSDFEPPQHFG